MATKVAGEMYEILTGQLFEIVRQLRQPNGYPFDPQMLKKHLQNGIEGRFSTGDKFLKLISGNESLILDAVDGTETLAKAKDLFTYIDSDFRTYGVDEEGPMTEETAVAVYEMARDATFSQMFSSLSSDLNKQCLTQAQTKNFVRKYRNWLRAEGYATFFQFKSGDNFFVAFVDLFSGGELRVGVSRFEVSTVWNAGNRHRLVVPQLV